MFAYFLNIIPGAKTAQKHDGLLRLVVFLNLVGDDKGHLRDLIDDVSYNKDYISTTFVAQLNNEIPLDMTSAGMPEAAMAEHRA